MANLKTMAEAVSSRAYGVANTISQQGSRAENSIKIQKTSRINTLESDVVSKKGDIDNDMTGWSDAREEYNDSLDLLEEQILGSQVGITANFAVAKDKIAEELAEFTADLSELTTKTDNRAQAIIAEFGTAEEGEAAFNAVFGA